MFGGQVIGLRPPCAPDALVNEKRGFFMSDIVFKSPKSVCQKIVHQTNISQIAVSINRAPDHPRLVGILSCTDAATND